MNKYNLEAGSTRNGNQTIFQNIDKISNYWANGKIKTSRKYLSKNTVNNKIFLGLTESLRQNLFDFVDLVYLDQNENLYEPDDCIRYLYFPETSVISEFQILEDGKTIEVAMTGCEGVVGISSLFNSHPSPYWMQVSIAGKAFRIDAGIFQDEFHYCEKIQKQVFDLVNLYFSQISQRAVCNVHHSIEERLCCWLLMLLDRCGTDNLHLTQEQIARYLGVHRPSITLITQSLRDKGIIDYIRGKIFILDRMKLESSSCICYSITKYH